MESISTAIKLQVLPGLTLEEASVIKIRQALALIRPQITYPAAPTAIVGKGREEQEGGSEREVLEAVFTGIHHVSAQQTSAINVDKGEKTEIEQAMQEYHRGIRGSLVVVFDTEGQMLRSRFNAYGNRS